MGAKGAKGRSINIELNTELGGERGDATRRKRCCGVMYEIESGRGDARQQPLEPMSHWRFGWQRLPVLQFALRRIRLIADDQCSSTAACEVKLPFGRYFKPNVRFVQLNTHNHRVGRARTTVQYVALLCAHVVFRGCLPKGSMGPAELSRQCTC